MAEKSGKGRERKRVLALPKDIFADVNRVSAATAVPKQVIKMKLLAAYTEAVESAIKGVTLTAQDVAMDELSKRIEALSAPMAEKKATPKPKPKSKPVMPPSVLDL